MRIRIDAILALTEGDLSADIGDLLSSDHSVTTVTSDNPDTIKHIAIALVSLHSRFANPRKRGFTHVCVVQKGQRIAFRQNRIKLSKGILLPDPLTRRWLLNAIPLNRRTSFLIGLREHQTIEDSIIDHDLHHLPGWDELY